MTEVTAVCHSQRRLLPPKEEVLPLTVRDIIPRCARFQSLEIPLCFGALFFESTVHQFGNEGILCQGALDIVVSTPLEINLKHLLGRDLIFLTDSDTFLKEGSQIIHLCPIVVRRVEDTR